MENSQVTAKKKTVVKAVKVIMALLLMVAIAFAAALIVHDSDRAVPAFTLSDGLSACLLYTSQCKKQKSSTVSRKLLSAG